MEELIKTISSKTGIPEDTAKKTVDIVLNFLKDKLPAPIASQVEGILKGNSGIESGITGLDL